MKEGWEVKKINDILDVKRGGSPRPIKKFLTDSEDGVNWIKISDATASSKYIYKTKQKITKAGIEKSRFVEEGDFLLSNSMSFGRPYILKTNGCIHDGWLVLKKKTNALDENYLYLLLSSNLIFKEFDRLAAGSTVRNLNTSLVKSVELPIPPLEEQHQIVEILDKAFAKIDQTIANIKQNIQNAEDLFQSKLNQIFSQKREGWEEKKLGEILKLKSGTNLPAKKMITGDIPVYGGNGIAGYHNEGNFEGKYIIIGRVGAQCGNVRFLDEKFWLTDNAFRVSEFKIDFDFKFLEAYLNFKNLRSYARQSAQPVISNSSLKNVILFFPLSLETQKSISSNIGSLRQRKGLIINKYSKKLQNLQELKKSLLEKAFSGELTKNTLK